jgi:hypothetical protein
MNTSQVSEINEFESDLIYREGDVEEDSDKEKNQNVIESNEKNNKNEKVEDDIIYIETVRATNTNFVSRGRGGCRGHDHGGKTTINIAYYFTAEYLKAVKNKPIDVLNNIQIRNINSSEKVQTRYSKCLRDKN